MPTRIAINGLGRIGRALLRIAEVRDDLEVAAVNDLVPGAVLARLVARDTLHGPFSREVRWDGEALALGGRRVPVFASADPGEIPWPGTGATVVVECTGAFRDRTAVAGHLRGTVGRVLLSANSPEADATICWGVNHADFEPRRHRVVSAASCTTNCLAVVASVLDREFGIERGLLDTVHCYNNNQHLVDSGHTDPRRARSATLNMIPTTTGAIAALGSVLPELAGRIQGLAVRVPVPDVSLIDLVVELRERPSLEAVECAFRSAAAGRLAGVLGVSEDEPVSSDLLSDPRSAVVDLPLLQSVDDRLHRVVAWYDNEWAYASRLADLAAWLDRGGSSAR